jgi:hypothetical protein
MHKQVAASATPRLQYWAKRMRSKTFKDRFTALAAAEIHALSEQKVKDVLDTRLVRALICEWDSRTLRHEAIADLVVQASRVIEARLTEMQQSLVGLLDKRVVASVDALLAEEMIISQPVEDLVAKIMQQEFVRSLFTDVIYTSIVAFNERINPFFGGITMALLEEQVKGFIRLFMPMIQKQATAFATDKRNQRTFSAFARAILRELLSEPLPRYFAMLSPTQKKKAEALIKQSIGAPKIESLIQDMALTVWEDLYRRIRNRRVGDLLHLEERARWLAERSADIVVPALVQPRILRFVVEEIALEERAVCHERVRRRRRPQKRAPRDRLHPSRSEHREKT